MEVTAGDFSGHTGINTEDHDNRPRGYGQGYKEGQRILKFFAVILVGYTLLKKRAGHLVTYESRPSKTMVDYCLVRETK